MSLLFSNDQQGNYPPSFYALTKPERPVAPALEGGQKADVAIIGAGFTGLSAALHLAQAGVDVALLDAHRVGFGASGRNGGQLGSGLRIPIEDIEKRMGMNAARQYWDLAEEAKALVKRLIAKHRIECDLTPGVAETICQKRGFAGLRAEMVHLQERYGYAHLQLCTADEMRAICPSRAYFGGLIDWDAAHLDPLAYAFGLADAALKAGARIYENTYVEKIAEGSEITLHCANGSMRAAHVLVACNGYLGDLSSAVAARVMPINNFIVVTEPLGARVSEVLTKDIAIADSKFVVNYFRLSKDGRLIFGGGESYGYRFPKDIAGLVRKHLLPIFPSLSDVRIEYAWGGTLAITRSRLPHFARLRSNMLSASGYSGHGIGTATHAGRLMADAILGQNAGLDLMAKLPNARFPGGALLRNPLLALGMSWFAMRDRLGI